MGALVLAETTIFLMDILECGREVEDGRVGIHVRDSKESQEFNEAPSAHAGESLSPLDGDEATVLWSTGEVEDKAVSI